jgi:hypothetical protein
MSKQIREHDHRFCWYCSKEGHSKKFVSIFKFLKSRIPEFDAHLKESQWVVHKGTCRQKLYDLVNNGMLPCIMDDRMNGDIAKYFVHCQNPLHIFHIHRSSIVPCSEKKSRKMFILYHAFATMNNLSANTKNYDPLYVSEEDKKPETLQKFITDLYAHSYNKNWYNHFDVIHSIIHSLIHSFIHSFIHLCVYEYIAIFACT